MDSEVNLLVRHNGRGDEAEPIDARVPPMARVRGGTHSETNVTTKLSNSMTIDDYELAASEIAGGVVVPTDVPVPGDGFIFVFVVCEDFLIYRFFDLLAGSFRYGCGRVCIYLYRVYRGLFVNRRYAGNVQDAWAKASRASDYCLSLAAHPSGTSGCVLQLCLGGFSPRLDCRFGVVWWVALANGVCPIRALAKYLRVGNGGDNVMANDRANYFASGAPKHLFVTTGADRGLFVPSARARCSFILCFFFCARHCLFRDRFTWLGSVLHFGRIVRDCLGFVQAVCLSNFRANCRFLNNGICVRRFVYLLWRAVKGALFCFSTTGILRFFICALSVLSISNESCVGALVRRYRCVLPAFLIRAAFGVNVYRLVCGRSFQVSASSNFGIRLFRFFPFVRGLPPQGRQRTLCRYLYPNAPVYFSMSCLRVCPIVRWVVYFLGRAVTLARANGRPSVSFGFSPT